MTMSSSLSIFACSICIYTTLCAYKCASNLQPYYQSVFDKYVTEYSEWNWQRAERMCRSSMKAIHFYFLLFSFDTESMFFVFNNAYRSIFQSENKTHKFFWTRNWIFKKLLPVTRNKHYVISQIIVDADRICRKCRQWQQKLMRDRLVHGWLAI